MFTGFVGHIIGLGDRHLSNILVDQLSWGALHIDFGDVSATTPLLLPAFTSLYTTNAGSLPIHFLTLVALWSRTRTYFPT